MGRRQTCTRQCKGAVGAQLNFSSLVFGDRLVRAIKNLCEPRKTIHSTHFLSGIQIHHLVHNGQHRVTVHFVSLGRCRAPFTHRHPTARFTAIIVAFITQ